MKICVKDQIRNPALPLKCVATLTGSALALEIYGVPAYMAGGAVTGVTVKVTNADGAEITGEATEDDGVWNILFAASNFSSYGFVSNGLHISIAVEGGDETYATTLFGDFEVKQSSATAVAGDPSTEYQLKGSDQYLKSFVVSGVQHYKKVVITNDARVGWAFDLEGDYILVDGSFVDYSE